MLFNSFSFAIFMTIVFIVYWAVAHRYRWILLLLSSYYFYMNWEPVYAVLIAFTTIVSFACGQWIEKYKEHKKVVLILGVVICLGILFVFKYAEFAINSILGIVGIFNENTGKISFNLILPVGISFYTFQTLSYIIDVYRGNIRAEKNIGIYALYVSFFPQLVAGPIERTERLIPQFREEKQFDYDKVVHGLLLIVWGLFKKIAIADALAVFVDDIFLSLETAAPLEVVISIFFFSLQIYCDFSGYSTMAVGVAKVLGFDLMSNFESPYLASTVKEFWRRWHISLTSWFTDYVYIPLGGSRVCKWKHYRNIMITFLLSGLWHGANWTFLIWGGLHGLYLIIGDFMQRIRIYAKFENRISKGVSILRTICTFILVTFAWIFFRSSSLSEALAVINKVFSVGTVNIKEQLIMLKSYRSLLVSLLPPLMILFFYDFFSQRHDILQKIHTQMKLVPRWGIYVLFMLVLLFFSVKNTAEVFIYFQF